MIDPKRVELTLYNKIPHLLTPVITDAKKAILALKWAAKEMSHRYDILEKYSVRDIDSYHKTVLTPTIEKYKKLDEEEQKKNPLPETMPYLVIVLDELADIMHTYPRELESATKRKCHYRSYKGQYSYSYSTTGIIPDRLKDNTRYRRCREATRSWRYAISRR
jgi:S-DNA-T family DNA segregation ATPase FtsK/SpoIIIE